MVYVCKHSKELAIHVLDHGGEIRWEITPCKELELHFPMFALTKSVPEMVGNVFPSSSRF